jgi:hypothetical protein
MCPLVIVSNAAQEEALIVRPLKGRQGFQALNHGLGSVLQEARIDGGLHAQVMKHPAIFPRENRGHVEEIPESFPGFGVVQNGDLAGPLFCDGISDL